jgi:hypothetical protein
MSVNQRRKSRLIASPFPGSLKRAYQESRLDAVRAYRRGTPGAAAGRPGRCAGERRLRTRRLRGARRARPVPPQPGGPITVQRRVSCRGSLMVARQKIHVGMIHAGKTATVICEDNQLRGGHRRRDRRRRAPYHHQRNLPLQSQRCTVLPAGPCPGRTVTSVPEMKLDTAVAAEFAAPADPRANRRAPAGHSSSRRQQRLFHRRGERTQSRSSRHRFRRAPDLPYRRRRLSPNRECQRNGRHHQQLSGARPPSSSSARDIVTALSQVRTLRQTSRSGHRPLRSDRGLRPVQPRHGRPWSLQRRAPSAQPRPQPFAPTNSQLSPPSKPRNDIVTIATCVLTTRLRRVGRRSRSIRGPGGRRAEPAAPGRCPRESGH